MDTLFWIRNLEHHLRLHQVVVLYGNVHDSFPFPADGNLEYRRLSDVVRWSGEQAGYTILNEHDLASPGTGGASGRTDPLRSLKLPEQQATLFLFRNAQALFSEITNWNQQDWSLYSSLLDLLERSDGRHRFVLSFPDEARIPVNFLVNVPAVKRFHVPRPEGLELEDWTGEQLAGHFSGDDDDNNQDERRRFVAMAFGLHWREIRAIRSALSEVPPASATNAETPLALLRRLKFGDSRDRWTELVSKNRERLAGAFGDLTGGDDPVLGQDDAVRKSVQVVARACFNVSELVSPSYRRPRGVLFFVGPTGVGKTMLAKKLAKLVFGDEGACITFDMSEYGLPQSEARLVGAPPGYVGYDAEGQLTGAVARNPFSVLLFDEIEKADGSVLTKFLQILDEGRLTDSKGQTVYFSECLIVFTSNVGQHEALAMADSATYDELASHYLTELARHEKFQQRPELLNRIGTSNVVPFRHVRRREIVTNIVDKLIHSAIDHFGRQPLPLELLIDRADELSDWIAKKAQWQQYGLRNVKQTFEAVVLEPLSVQLLSNPANEPLRLSILDDRVRVEIES